MNSIDKLFAMKFNRVYLCLIQKAERKGYTRSDVDEITCRLLGYTPEQLRLLEESDLSYYDFFANCPQYNEAAESLSGTICKVRVQEIEDPVYRHMR